MPALVVQSFGKEYEYKRAIFAILSFYANTSDPSIKTLLFTDNSTYFDPYLQAYPVEYRLLTPDRIRQMRGPIDFLHRMKIAMIEEAFDVSGEDLIYTDSDTFFINDPAQVLGKLNPGTSFMHRHEYVFDELKNMSLPAGATFHAFLKLINEGSLTSADSTNYLLSSDMSSWNAGVMVFHRSHRSLLRDVYALTDQFFPATQNHASEQYAFSIVLQTSTNVQSCEGLVEHYWYRIKKQVADHYFEAWITPVWAQRSENEKQRDVKIWAYELLRLFETHVWILRDNAVQALNRNEFGLGYRWAMKALLRDPFNMRFLRDVAYHMKRQIQLRSS